ncbi:MAG TPA: Fic family protein [Solirubrobacterales bacterium]|jgi:Fic family protein|nr:Fic family protein [Solirubrobacterales bacterium]
MSWVPDFARAGGRQSRAGRYEAFVPDPVAEYEPELSSATSTLAERAGLSVRELNADPEGLLSPEGLGRQLLRSEALASSQIEGLNISPRKLAEADLADRDGHHKAQEIVGNIRALELATEIGADADPLDVDAITRIHREMTTGTSLDRIAGQLREEPSWIGGRSPVDAEFVGPPWQKVRPLLEDLCEFMDRDDISPVAQAAIAHAQFELIHPFGDGNGRVGRCLIQVIFRRRKLAPRYLPPVSIVLGANKDAYISGLESFREDQVDGWVLQFARAVETASEQARSFSSSVAELQEAWRTKLGRVRSDAAVLSVISLLSKFPILTTGVAEKEIGRSRPVTIEALDRLESIGALTRHRNQKKGDSWEAKELFALLDEFERRVRRPAG